MGAQTLSAQPTLFSGQNQSALSACTDIKVPPVLKKGSTDFTTGGSVSKLQKGLKYLGYFAANPTGYFGTITYQSVLQFQVDRGLTPDGVFGSATSLALKNATCTTSSTGSSSTSTGSSATINPHTNSTSGGTNTSSPSVGTNTSGSTGTNTTSPGTTVTQNPSTSSTTGSGTTANGTTAVSSPAPCTPTTTPYVYVVTPNGGEVYNATDKLIAEWKSCNLTSDTTVDVSIMRGVDTVMTAHTQNTGTYSFQLSPSAITNPVTVVSSPLQFGNYFKVKVVATTATGVGYTDESDSTFTITNGTNNTGGGTSTNGGTTTTTGGTGTVPGCLPTTAYSPTTGQPCNPNTSIHMACITTTNPQVLVLAPNTASMLTIGSTFSASWMSCNLAATADLQISMVRNPGVSASVAGNESILLKATPNDGGEKVTLVPISGSPALVPGKYVMRITYLSTGVYDDSDAYIELQ